MNNNQRLNNQKESNINYRGLLVAIILFVFLIIGLIILIIVINNNHNQEEEPSTDVTEVQYNKLLKILNDKIDETKLVDKESVNSITTFMYKDNKFHIASYNDKYVYDLSLKVDNISNEVDAYNYIVSDSTTTYVLDYLDRYDLSSSNEFNNKYIVNGYVCKSAVAMLGSETFTYLTRMNNDNKDISIICGDSLNTVLQDNYSIKTIQSSHQLHDIYQYIVSK